LYLRISEARRKRTDKVTVRISKRPFIRPGCALLLLVLALCAGCSESNPFRAIERSTEAQLPRLIGPADKYEVSVSRSSGSLVAGHIPWIEIRGRNVRAIQGLNLDMLQIRLEEVSFNRSTRTVKEIKQSGFVARLSAASITQFIRRRSPNLGDVQVRFGGGKVRVHASPGVLGIGVPVEVEGRPKLHGGTAIDFDADRLAVLHLGLPEFAVRRLEAHLNPLVDLATMPFPLQLAEARIEGDQALISGTAVLKPDQFQGGRHQ